LRFATIVPIVRINVPEKLCLDNDDIGQSQNTQQDMQNANIKITKEFVLRFMKDYIF